jgi:activating signal cointegrator complex subunit 3
LTTSTVTKPKDESWILILGNSDTGELICLKRMKQVIRQHMTVSLSFVTSANLGRQRLTLYFLSDGYLGLDQQYDFFLDVEPASLQAQINTELDPLADELERRLATLQ